MNFSTMLSANRGRMITSCSVARDVFGSIWLRPGDAADKCLSQTHKQKRRLPEEAAFCLIVTRREEFLCPWQAWQRPTLPGLKP